MKWLFMVAFLFGFARNADAFTCAQVRWAVKNMPPDLLASYVAAATPEQIAFGKRCLRKPQAKRRRRPHR